jgi:hypothetical protein
VFPDFTASTVRIPRPYNGVAIKAGFIVEGGLIVTYTHVIGAASGALGDTVQATFRGGRESARTESCWGFGSTPV